MVIRCWFKAATLRSGQCQACRALRGGIPPIDLLDPLALVSIP